MKIYFVYIGKRNILKFTNFEIWVEQTKQIFEFILQNVSHDVFLINVIKKTFRFRFNFVIISRSLWRLCVILLFRFENWQNEKSTKKVWFFEVCARAIKKWGARKIFSHKRHNTYDLEKILARPYSHHWNP